MSEAFANRHHHCERVDSLNRGIWTSYGPGGTQENPTGPPVEMYLRCNHDNCRRIDWRTVHGLQCHIVKNHEQPKGTIGSLEKALDRYGVPIREVEEYEQEHGEGTGGTMADPKNLKIKNKTREAYNRKSTPGSYGVDPTARPAGYKPSPPALRASPTIANPEARTSTGSVVRHPYLQEESTYSDTDDSGSVHGEGRKSGAPPMNTRFEAIRNDWRSSNSNAAPPARGGMDPNRQLQGDAVMRDAPPPSTWKHWSPSQPPQEATAPLRTVSIPEPPHTVSNESIPQPSGPDSTAPCSTPNASGGVPSTQTPTVPDQVKEIEERQEKEDVNLAAPSVTQTQNADTHMTDVLETQPPVAQIPEPRKEEEKDKVGGPAAGDTAATSSGAMEVDGEKKQEQVDGTADSEAKDETTASGGPASGTRSALQSPVMTSKPLNPPSSAKRMSRRSSTARKLSGDSADGQSEVSKGTEGTVGDAKESERDASAREPTEEGIDGDSITVATSTSAAMRKERDDALRDAKEREARTPPRRNANGRFTRRRMLERGY
jgi:hypothetical protein